MTVDWDGRIRMDSSPYAMASLVGMKDRFDIAGNDPNGPSWHRQVARR